MSLFTLLKLTRTRHLLGGKRGTPGAAKVIEESRHWYAYRRDGGKQVKVRLFTDKAASLAEVARMNTALERGEAGMVNPHKAHLNRPVAEHREEYLTSITASGKVKPGKYLSEKRRILTTIFRRAGVATLATRPLVSVLRLCATGYYLWGSVIMYVRSSGGIGLNP